MINKDILNKWRFWVIFLSITISCILTYNRFSFPLIDNVKYDFIFRNFIEHFTWGFTLPILTTIFFLGLGQLSKLKISWKFGYYSGMIIFILVGFYYYLGKIEKTGLLFVDYIKICLDIAGLIFSSWFIISGRSKYNV